MGPRGSAVQCGAEVIVCRSFSERLNGWIWGLGIIGDPGLNAGELEVDGVLIRSLELHCLP